jgi:uncharacterized protein (TIGR02246 family)
MNTRLPHPNLEIPLDNTGTEEDIRQLFARTCEAWNQGNAHAYAECFTSDADYVVFDGTHLKSRAAIEHSHTALFSTFLKGSTLEGELTDLRHVSPDVVLCHGVGAVRLRWQHRTSSGRDSIQTYLAVRGKGIWQFAAFHNTRIQRPNAVQTLLMRVVHRERMPA